MVDGRIPAQQAKEQEDLLFDTIYGEIISKLTKIYQRITNDYLIFVTINSYMNVKSRSLVYTIIIKEIVKYNKYELSISKWKYNKDIVDLFIRQVKF